VAPPAAASTRFGAFTIDVIVAAVPGGLAAWRAVVAVQSETSVPAAAWAAGVAGFMVAMTLVLVLEILVFGRTAGGWRRLIVLGPDGTPAGRRRLITRELARLGLIELPAMVAGAGLLGIAPIGRRGRGWHDVVSGTRVVAPSAAPDLELFAAVRGHLVAPSGAEYATFSERAGAWLIDMGLILTAWATAVATASLALDTSSDSPPRWFIVLILIAFPVIDLTYRIGALVWRGTTVGLGALGYVVLRAEDEGDIRFWRAVRREVLGRWIVMYGSLVFTVGVVLIPLDFLMPLWQDRRQTLHDQIGATIVARGEPRPWRRPRPQPTPPPAPVPA
jgi:hypothetical protein